MRNRRVLLALRAIDVSFRDAIRDAPSSGAEQVEWVDHAVDRARYLLDDLESTLRAHGTMDPEVELQLRVVREGVRRVDAATRSATDEADADRTADAGADRG